MNPDRKATAKDVLEIINRIKGGVFKKYGIKLEEEVFYLDNGKEDA